MVVQQRAKGTSHMSTQAVGLPNGQPSRMERAMVCIQSQQTIAVAAKYFSRPPYQTSQWYQGFIILQPRTLLIKKNQLP
jgi:hypothetical protein